MTVLDYAALGVFAASTALGAWRGLVRTVFSMAGWIIALLASQLYAGPASALLPPDLLPTPELRLGAAYAALFIGTVLACAIAGWLLSKVVQAVGLGFLDTALGLVLGGARGVLILLAGAILAGLTALPRQPAWTQSMSGPAGAAVVLALRPVLPQALGERLRYD